jgi:dTDP-L-rhamnose 4-epimerase
MSERVLITGGAGFIGSHLVDALLRAGHQVRIYDNLDPQVHGDLRDEGKWPEYLSPDCERVRGDVRDRDSLRDALRDVNVVFHQAAAVGVGQSMYEIERYVDVNSRGTGVLLDILANETHQVRKLVVASSMSIYGEGAYYCATHGEMFPRLRSEHQLSARDWELRCPTCGEMVEPLATDETKPLYPTSVYAITKMEQEEMCLIVGRTYGIPTVALRYFNVYGARQALGNPYTGVAAIFSARILNGKAPVVFEDGCQRRDLVHVSDIVQANLMAMEREEMDYNIYNVSSGSPLTILQVAETLAQHLGSTHSPEITHQYRAGDIRHCFADIGRLSALGYRPQVSFSEGVAELVEWVRVQTAADTFDSARSELEERGLAA